MFNKNEQRPAVRSGSGSMSFLGAEVTITGNIGGQGNLHIDGRVDGDVNCASLIIGNSGQVNGNITADDAKVAGTVTGTVAAKVLTIEASARITGDLSYDSVSVETGAQVDGRVKRLSREDSGGLKLIASD
jgi:cytoskeletal protein CcmA (bactofilin family)